MKLYCVRHCEANNADVDAQRGLSEQGISDANKLAEHLQSQGLIISQVMHSGKKRARQTAEIISSGCQVESMVESPNLLDDQADASVVAQMASAWQQNTMLVGHMPFMANLVTALVMDVSDNMQLVTYAPGTMVCLNNVGEGRWVIDWVLQPDNL